MSTRAQLVSLSPALVLTSVRHIKSHRMFCMELVVYLPLLQRPSGCHMWDMRKCSREFPIDGQICVTVWPPLSPSRRRQRAHRELR